MASSTSSTCSAATTSNSVWRTASSPACRSSPAPTRASYRSRATTARSLSAMSRFVRSRRRSKPLARQRRARRYESVTRRGCRDRLHLWRQRPATVERDRVAIALVLPRSTDMISSPGDSEPMRAARTAIECARRCAARLAVAAVLATALAAQDGKVAFADFGHEFLQALGEREAPPLPDLLERYYARLLLGGFDLRVPKNMLDKGDDVARVAAIAGALLDLQEHLAEWTAVDQGALKAERAELALLHKFVGAWRNKPNATEPPAGPLRPAPCVLVIAPDRKNFVGLVGCLGLWKKDCQDIWWHDATA